MKHLSTKRAWLMSVLSLVLCVTMLVGSTFAWFTDTASTGVNTIQAGNLDVALEYATAWDADGNPTAWENAEGKTLNFRTADGRTENILWEPGCTYALPELRVVNKGNLSLKYRIVITGINGDAALNKAIDWTMSGTEDSALTAGASNLVTIWGHMREDAGNEYQGLSITGISITVYATQYTGESDSTGNTYDELAPNVLPAGITADSFTGDNTLYVVNADGTTGFYKTLKDAMAATSAAGSTIYAKPDVTVTADGTHFNILGDLTVYGNSADFGGTDISAEEYKEFTADITVNIYNTKNLYVWGTRKTAYTLTLNFENCYNENNQRLCYLNYGSTGENHVTVKDCWFKNIETAIYTSNAGSLTVENCRFDNCEVPVNINTKTAGTMTTVIRDCTFVNCATGTGSYERYNGVIRLVNTNKDATDTATVENCTFLYDAGKAPLCGDILLGDTRTLNDKPCYPLTLTVKNTNALVQEYNDNLAVFTNVEGNGTVLHQGSADMAAYTLEQFNALTELPAGKTRIYVDLGSVSLVGADKCVTVGNYYLSDEYMWVNDGEDAPEGFTATTRRNAQNNATAYRTYKDAFTLYLTGTLTAENYSDGNFSGFQTLCFQLPEKSTAVLDGMTLNGSFNISGSYKYMYNLPDGSIGHLQNPVPAGYTNVWYDTPIVLENIRLSECTINGQWFANGNVAKNVEINGCVFNDYENIGYANWGNPIWWKNASATNLTITHCNVTSTRPMKIGEGGIGSVTITDNTFTMLAGDKYTNDAKDKVKNTALSLGNAITGDVLICGNTVNAEATALLSLLDSGMTMPEGKTFTVSGNTLNGVPAIVEWKKSEAITPDFVKFDD